PVLLLHGLSATRRYVLHGSTALERSDRRVVGFDARGHGESDPAPDPAAYRYADMADDAIAVLDAAGIDRAALVGQAMGAATAGRGAPRHPERVGPVAPGAPAA